MSLVLTALEKKYGKKFDYSLTFSDKEFNSALGVFKVVALDGDENYECNLRWNAPSTFLKNNKLKEAVWEDVLEHIEPILSKDVVLRKELSISDQQLQQLMSQISKSKMPFKIQHPDGYTIGINTSLDVDFSLNAADLSSMLAASWLFNSKGVRLLNG